MSTLFLILLLGIAILSIFFIISLICVKIKNRQMYRDLETGASYSSADTSERSEMRKALCQLLDDKNPTSFKILTFLNRDKLIASRKMAKPAQISKDNTVQ